MKKVTNDYQEFLETKRNPFISSGFEIEESILNNNLFDFQKYIVKTALSKGRFAVFADCGLGKTLMQLEWAHQVALFTNMPVLVLAPLAVTKQTIREGEKFGLDIYNYEFNATPCANEPDIFIINYDQLKNIDCSIFGGVVLDESSILKGRDGKLSSMIIEQFKNTPYKLACTATPSPNDHMELGQHSEFLGAMAYLEMLAMYFVHDGGETSKWRLRKHAKDAFWNYVCTWSIAVDKPETLGFHMDGYNLPGLNMIEHKIITPKRDNESLFNDMAVSATNFNQELRNTRHERMKKAAEIANATDEQVIIWIKHNDEGKWLTDNIPDAVEVKGSDDHELKKKCLLGFANNEFRVLITKSKIAQFGLNYQNCHIQIFASLDFSFEALYQSIRRSYRFGQDKPVDIIC
jgi:hypothetical protein